MKKMIMLLFSAIIIFSCSKTNLSLLAQEQALIAQTTAIAVSGSASSTSCEEEFVIFTTAATSSTCCIKHPEVCKEAYLQVTEASKGVIKTTGGGTWTPPDWINLQNCFDKMFVTQTITASQIVLEFTSIATKKVLYSRALKVTANKSVYHQAALKQKSSLTFAMLADAVKDPSDKNLGLVVTNLYDLINMQITINK